MMSDTSNIPASTPPVAVVSTQFCVGYPVDLTVTQKMMTLKHGTFGVTDVNGNIMFQINGKALSLHSRRVLLDAAGVPLVTFQQKMMTAHRRWQVFRGESTEPKDVIFSVRKSTVFQMKTKLEVFMAANTEENRCDFRIEGNWFETACVIYVGDTNDIIAQMHRKHSAQSILLGKDTFWVTVYPNVDHAFVVALIAILEEINEDRKQS
ncbi:hypothetical protein C2S53_020922 [Perilla frutescens var. hirtella]|uniref:Uncharacterized protein n=1 Tax=Perilla frutescens var. hirtella TaxID=608512 RepID=A0AAD4NYA8_PERFH|nr:hypothetical protein C2S53_020922 [Perilla frutescens var. hirtella]